MMPQVHIISKINIDLDEVLDGVAQLDTPTLEQFVYQVSSLLAHRKAPSLSQRETELLAEINRGLATAKRLPEFRKEVGVLEAQLDRLRAVLPEEQDVADLLRRVQAMATQSNLAIRGFTPQTVSRKTLHAEWPIGLKLEGTYHDLGAFLERVSKFPRIINVGNIKIKARDVQTLANTVDAECTATTFVLLDQKAAAPPTKPGPGGRGAAPPAPKG